MDSTFFSPNTTSERVWLYAYPVSILHNLILPLSSIWDMPFCQCRGRRLLFLLRRSIILSWLFTPPIPSRNAFLFYFSFRFLRLLLPIILHQVQVWLFLVKGDFIWNCMLASRKQYVTLFELFILLLRKICVVFTGSVERNLSQAIQLYLFRVRCKRKTKTKHISRIQTNFPASYFI